MKKAPIYVYIAAIVALAGIAFGGVAIAGGFSSDSGEEGTSSATGGPTQTTSPDLSASASLDVSPSSDVSPNGGDSGDTGAGKSTNGPDDPTVTFFRSMHANVPPDSFIDLPIVFAVSGEILLVEGVHAWCETTFDGHEWPMEATFTGDGEEGEYVPFTSGFTHLGVVRSDVFPWTMACASSDGAEWSESGALSAHDPGPIPPPEPPADPPPLPGF